MFDLDFRCSYSLSSRSSVKDALATAKRSARKKTDDNNISTQNKTALQNIVFKPENIWDLQGTHAMLEALSM